MLIHEYFRAQLDALTPTIHNDPLLYFILDHTSHSGFEVEKKMAMEVVSTKESELEHLASLTFSRMSGNIPVFEYRKMVEHELL